MSNDTAARVAGTTLEHRIGPRGRFVLHQAAGEVSIRGVEGETVRVRSLDGRAFSDLFTVETGDDVVELKQIEKFGLAFLSRREGAELEIDVPHGATLTIDTQSADIEARDLSGVKSFRSASGEVTLTRLAGAVEVETVSGEIEVTGQAPIDLNVRTVSGDIEIRVPSVRTLNLGTTSGDARLDAGLAGEGPFAIRTISGDVTVVGRNGFRVEAESITGDLSSDVPSKRESGVGRKILIVGRPGPTLSFRSVSGDFHVAQPRDAAPELDVAAPEPPAPPSAPPAPGAATRPSPLAPAAPPAPTGSGTPVAAAIAAADAAASAIDVEAHRMTILRALERGDISVTEATDRLGRLDDEVLR